MTGNRKRCSDPQVASSYDLLHTIGRGHYAVVKEGKHTITEEKVAVKIIDKTKLEPKAKANLYNEVRCMQLVQHPHVVKLFQVIDTPSRLYLILELGDGGDMHDYIVDRYPNGMPENVAKHYFRQLIRAIHYCHQLHVVHRDLKLENVILFQKTKEAKLTDFGFSCLFTPGSKLETSCGSLAYTAPEVLLGELYDATAADIWSLAVMLFMLISGELPFQESNDSETVTRIMDCIYSLPAYSSPELKNLLQRMLQRDPKQRITVKEILQHCWLSGCSVGRPSAESALFDPSKPFISHEHLADDDREAVLRYIEDSNIATREQVLSSLRTNAYDHVSATFYLLAERTLRSRRTAVHDGSPSTSSATASSTSTIPLMGSAMALTASSASTSGSGPIGGAGTIGPSAGVPPAGVPSAFSAGYSLTSAGSPHQRGARRFSAIQEDAIQEDVEESEDEQELDAAVPVAPNYQLNYQLNDQLNDHLNDQLSPVCLELNQPSAATTTLGDDRLLPSADAHHDHCKTALKVEEKRVESAELGPAEGRPTEMRPTEMRPAQVGDQSCSALVADSLLSGLRSASRLSDRRPSLGSSSTTAVTPGTAAVRSSSTSVATSGSKWMRLSKSVGCTPAATPRQSISGSESPIPTTALPDAKMTSAGRPAHSALAKNNSTARSYSLDSISPNRRETRTTSSGNVCVGGGNGGQAGKSSAGKTKESTSSRRPLRSASEHATNVYRVRRRLGSGSTARSVSPSAGLLPVAGGLSAVPKFALLSGKGSSTGGLGDSNKVSWPKTKTKQLHGKRATGNGGRRARSKGLNSLAEQLSEDGDNDVDEADETAGPASCIGSFSRNLSGCQDVAMDEWDSRSSSCSSYALNSSMTPGAMSGSQTPITGLHGMPAYLAGPFSLAAPGSLGNSSFRRSRSARYNSTYYKPSRERSSSLESHASSTRSQPLPRSADISLLGFSTTSQAAMLQLHKWLRSLSPNRPTSPPPPLSGHQSMLPSAIAESSSEFLDKLDKSQLERLLTDSRPTSATTAVGRPVHQTSRPIRNASFPCLKQLQHLGPFHSTTAVYKGQDLVGDSFGGELPLPTQRAASNGPAAVRNRPVISVEQADGSQPNGPTPKKSKPKSAGRKRTHRHHHHHHRHHHQTRRDRRLFASEPAFGGDGSVGWYGSGGGDGGTFDVIGHLRQLLSKTAAVAPISFVDGSNAETNLWSNQRAKHQHGRPLARNAATQTDEYDKHNDSDGNGDDDDEDDGTRPAPFSRHNTPDTTVPATAGGGSSQPTSAASSRSNSEISLMFSQFLQQRRAGLRRRFSSTDSSLMELSNGMKVLQRWAAKRGSKVYTWLLNSFDEEKKSLAAVGPHSVRPTPADRATQTDWPVETDWSTQTEHRRPSRRSKTSAETKMGPDVGRDKSSRQSADQSKLCHPQRCCALQ